ncbi:diguanylate cyclase/phosphodiesterase (GGDEF & EAL domains) with PAS/PAC sensor(s) [Methylophaga frappieri]|uniref:Diguanylate cyclase/phosphodiesterase (GGDEF & EAL domains) with PAS/PAC sensor(S) n=2 Tax=Methylophaga frappieri (strain ATCC BAA-2434 / DSM 25690 / JAM7) TaxID=754477 RepID=I1YH37_METFJ|nr:diguanylate cyclase/phosphodiesterase (GGDEF & EAL domains) with PAS/PAC sensor(s) [Methylophaga frappieri]
MGVFFSINQFHQNQSQAETALKSRFDTIFQQVTLVISDKVNSYDQMLRATQGLFQASYYVSRNEFKVFADKLQLETIYPGLLGLGYSQLVLPEARVEHEAMIRKQGFPDYKIYPEGEREIYSSIIYLEPFKERNLRAFGYDMASNSVRSEAMWRARDTLTTAMSGGVKLVQDLPGESVTGLLMYLPTFKNVGLLNDSVSASKREHTGWVYVVFRIEDIIRATLAHFPSLTRLQINDISPLNGDVLFDTGDFDDHWQLTETSVLAGRQWQFSAQPDMAFRAQYLTNWPIIRLVLELLFTVALMAISWLLINGKLRAEKLANNMTAQLREQNQRLSLATETAKMGIWDWDFETDRMWLDGNLAKLMGLQRTRSHQILFQDWCALFDEQDRARLEQEIDYVINNRVDLNIELLFQLDAYNSRMIQLNAVMRFNHSGQPTGMVGVSFDITDRWFYQSRLEQTEARWKFALEGSGEGVWDWTLTDDSVIYSERLVTMLGYSPDDFTPHFSEWADRIHPDDLPQVQKDLTALFDGSQPAYRNEHRIKCRDGSWKWILAKGIVIERDEHGEPLRAVGTNSDISWRKDTELALRQSEERFRNAFDTAAIGMALVSIEGRWLEVNPALCDMLGYTEAELMALTFMDITHPEDLDLDQHFVRKLLDKELDHYHIEKRYFCRGGEIIDVLLSVSVVHDEQGGVLHFVSQVEDITTRKQEEAHIRKMAFYDALTGLPNRRLYEEHFGMAIQQARRNKQVLALMFVDIDYFKSINDNYGHDAGDLIIQVVAEKMSNTLRASDTLARLGGDEFVVVLHEVSSPDAALHVAQNLVASVSEPIELEDGTAVQVTLSIGVTAGIPTVDDAMTHYLKQADMALYDVKAAGRNGASLYQASGA